MFSSRLFVALLLPLILIGCCLYFVTTGVNRGDVRVAGALVGADQADATVKTCTIIQDQGARRLLLELDVSNGGDTDLTLIASEFKIVLSRKDRPLGNNAQSTFEPLSSSSFCALAPGSQSSIPPNSTRSYTLRYWAETLPEGSEWDDYFLTLECYSSQSSLMLSKQLSIAGK